ncbi:MAG: hypothetical protein Unbinned200contig1000_75 [Prokaryotic dsDNA virus sp.]|jgi:hypothetical protein|nr:hypothetical protein [Flavobacteriaceae bacterium]QDP65335.1 MAG: hypothetical protein Unbinned200contig1000_75 [Prokaryotic dsDNA virus sp.]|tara:strand:+ start:9505 stop:9831 length:327 start_codon:yes stop_codon:yes gene_type:complete
MRGILIDPWLKTITEVECGETIEDIYRLLSNPLGPKVHIFTMATYWPNGDTLYVDDEGLLKPKMRLFNIDGQLLAGNGLILGSDREGNSVDAKSSLVEIQRMVTWTSF